MKKQRRWLSQANFTFVIYKPSATIIINSKRFRRAWAHVADLFTCGIGGNLLRRTKTPIASSTFMRSKFSHKVGCKYFLCRTSIGCLLPSISCLLPPQLPYLSVSIQIAQYRRLPYLIIQLVIVRIPLAIETIFL